MPSPHPFSFLLAQASFEPNSYLYKYPSRIVPVILLVHTTYEDGTDRAFQNKAYKIQMPGNHPKERIQHTYTYSRMWTTAEFPIPTAQSTKVSYLILDFHVKSHSVQIQIKHNRQMTSSKFRCCQTCKSNGPSIFGWVTYLVRKWISTSIQLEGGHFLYFYRSPIFKNKKN